MSSQRYRPSGSESRFLDREEARELFSSLRCSNLSPTPILNFYGVGGIGKTRLLTELKSTVSAQSVTLRLELELPKHREHLSGLRHLRNECSQQSVSMDRFDVAFAMLWQKSNPGVPLTGESDPIVSTSSEILAKAVDAMLDSGFPVVGSIYKFLKEVGPELHLLHQISQDKDLLKLDEQPAEKLKGALAFFLASELNRLPEPSVLFIDDYELAAGHAQVSAPWIDDFIFHLEKSLVVIASADKLPSTPDGSILRAHELSGLPEADRAELLRLRDVSEAAIPEICANSEGLPFFLQLAADAHSQGATDFRKIGLLDKFLGHLDPNCRYLVEALGIARSFDEDLFNAVSQVIAGQTAWERFLNYSFVETAGNSSYRLHSVASAAIAEQLAAEKRLAATHAIVFDAVLSQGSGDRHLREQIFHGLAAGKIGVTKALALADCLKDQEGLGVLGGIAADLHWLEKQHPDLNHISRLRLCLQAESDIGIGAANLVASIAGQVPINKPSDQTEARLLLATGHAYRMLGEPPQLALARYEQVRAFDDGSHSFEAGHWVADLLMAQGIFGPALRTVDELEVGAADGHANLRAEISRLRHLAHRFAFDLDEAEKHWLTADSLTAAIDDPHLLADLKVNRIELLAWTDPAEALANYEPALNRQKELGAYHEIGKCLTAAGFSAIADGNLALAQELLDDAVSALATVSYASGSARAELALAALAARSDVADEAASHALKSVKLFTQCEVYPTLVVAACRLAERIGQPSPAMHHAAGRALDKISMPEGAPPLESSISKVLSLLLGDELDAQRSEAKNSPEALSGSYNFNLRRGSDLIRVPQEAQPSMDLKKWPEHLTLHAVHQAGLPVPALRASVTEPAVQIHEFIEGDVLESLAPKGTPLATDVPGQLGAFLASLKNIQSHDLAEAPTGWPKDGDSVGFANRLLRKTHAVHCSNRTEFESLWELLGFPDSPLVGFGLDVLQPRPFQLIHCDVHRKNVIVRPSGQCVVIDWELALWGDPVYDLAVHLHKMDYLPPERTAAEEAWCEQQNGTALTDWETGVEAYLRHERAKSAIVDSVRYVNELRRADRPLEQAARLAWMKKLSRKLTPAFNVWGVDKSWQPDELLEVVDRWLACQPANQRQGSSNGVGLIAATTPTH